MKNKLKSFSILVSILILIVGLQACSNDDLSKKVDQSNIEDPVVKEAPKDSIVVPEFTPLGVVDIFNNTKVDDNYILVNDAAANKVYLMNKQARLLKEWSFSNNIGNDVVLLPNGKLLASLESDDPQILIGGKGGRLQIIKADETVEWDFIYSSLEGETHHDAELLPNGNIIVMVWQRISAEDAMQAGLNLNLDIFPESIIEINPATDEIVWEWHSLDHLIQEHDENKDNFGIVANHPELIDINYVYNSGFEPAVKGDIMHANAITYDEVNDVIFLSVNYFSEVWAIDHSTTSDEAFKHTGGNYNKGGDLIYRFGNPEAYQNPEGTRLFYNNHFPNLLEGEDLGKLLIFSNGNGFDQSTVYELELPANYDLQRDRNNEPSITWSFTDSNLYSSKVSGAVPLPNGNILITEGDYGFWEVTRDKEVVWKCNIEGFFWRGYHYSKSAPEILALDL